MACMQGRGGDDAGDLGCVAGRCAWGPGLGLVGRGEMRGQPREGVGCPLIHGRASGEPQLAEKALERYVVFHRGLGGWACWIGESGNLSWPDTGRGKIHDADLHRVSGCK